MALAKFIESKGFTVRRDFYFVCGVLVAFKFISSVAFIWYYVSQWSFQHSVPTTFRTTFSKINITIT